MHFVVVQSKCTNEAYGLYCTDLSNEDDSEVSITFKTNLTVPDDQIKAIFLKNSSGKLGSESFTLFPNVKSLDIQYCEIDGFSTGDVDLQNLYLMSNKKFPLLTKEFLGNCCGNLMTLYIFDNKELEIEDGMYKIYELEVACYVSISFIHLKHREYKILFFLCENLSH